MGEENERVIRVIRGSSSFVDHLYATPHRLDKELNKLSPEARPPRIEKLAALASKWSGKFGYGISDELRHREKTT